MKRSIEQSERKTVPRRVSRRWRILAGLGLASVLAGGFVEANNAVTNALAGSIIAVNGPADSPVLQPAIRLNPPKSGLANHEAYMLGDSLTVAISQTDTKQYAASLGWDLTFNSRASRGLYMACDLPRPNSACATLSDGITQINLNAEQIAKKCTFIMWLGTNAPERDEIYTQKYAQAFDKVNLIWDEDPAKTCPAGQRRFMAVNMSYGPRASAGFVQHMNERNQIIQDTIGPVYGAIILDMNGFVTANGVLNNSLDGVHTGTAGATKEGHFIVGSLVPA